MKRWRKLTWPSIKRRKKRGGGTLVSSSVIKQILKGSAKAIINGGEDSSEEESEEEEEEGDEDEDEDEEEVEEDGEKDALGADLVQSFEMVMGQGADIKSVIDDLVKGASKINFNSLEGAAGGSKEVVATGGKVYPELDVKKMTDEKVAALKMKAIKRIRCV